MESGRYHELADCFAPDAAMSFVGVPVEPYQGRGAILAGYEQSPPDDTMEAVAVTSDGPTDVVRFLGFKGGSGSVTLRWDGELIAGLDVAFDPTRPLMAFRS